LNLFVTLSLQGPIMVPIILGSIIALAFILDRVWTLWRIRLNIPQFAQEIFLYLERGQFQKALERCGKVRHFIADVFKLGIVKRSTFHDQ
jgi:biopolymer transport protein ExbB/TolQ